MIIVRFQGGLGNQMFQYAFMCNLQTVFSDIDVCADLTDYRLQDYHYGMELGRVFNVTIQEATDADIKRISNRQPWKYGRNVWRIYRKINKVFFGKEDSLDKNCCGKPATYYVQKADDTWKDISLIDVTQDWYFDGFWQNEQFFYNVNKQISNLFSFKESDYVAMRSIVAEIQGNNSVGIHVRRGDYVGTSFDCLPRKYYEEAIDYLSQKVESPFFYFFSEDYDYVKQRFSYLKNKKIVTANLGTNSYRDLLLMTCCKHNIIANSSFSYWGAHLNKHNGKIVIAPRYFIFESRRPALADKGWVLL